MKKGNKNFIIKLGAFPFDVMFSFGETDKEVFAILRQKGIPEKELEHASIAGVGRYCLFENGASLVRLKCKPTTPFDYGCLQHEIFHAVSSILWHIGMKLEIKTSDEAYAYLIGYLTEEVYKRI